MHHRCTLCHRETDTPDDGNRCPSCGGPLVARAARGASSGILTDVGRARLAPEVEDVVGKGAAMPANDAPTRGDDGDDGDDDDGHIDTRTLDLVDTDRAGESAAAQAIGRLVNAPAAPTPVLEPVEPSTEEIEAQLDVGCEDREPRTTATTRREDDREFWEDERPFDPERERAASIEGLEFEDEGLEPTESSAAKALGKLAHIDPKKAVPKVSFRDLPPLPDKKGKKRKVDRTPVGTAKGGGGVDAAPRAVVSAPQDDTELRRIEASLDYSMADAPVEAPPDAAVVTTRKDDDSVFWKDEAFDAQRDAAPKMAGIKLDDAVPHFESGAAELRGRAHGDASLIKNEEAPLTNKLIEQVPDDLKHAHIQAEEIALPWTEAFARPWTGQNKLHLVAIALVFGVLCDFGVLFGGSFLTSFARGAIIAFIWPGTLLFCAALALAVGTISAHMMATANWVRGGRRGVADTPDLSDFWGDFLKPAFQMFTCKAMYLGIGLAFILAGAGLEGAQRWSLFGCGAVWMLLGSVSFGMALAALVETGSIWAINPVTVWGAIGRTWRSYTRTSAQLLAGGFALVALEVALWQSLAWLPPLANGFVVPLWLGAYSYTNLVVATWAGDFARVEARALGWSVKR